MIHINNRISFAEIKLGMTILHSLDDHNVNLYGVVVFAANNQVLLMIIHLEGDVEHIELLAENDFTIGTRWPLHHLDHLYRLD